MLVIGILLAITLLTVATIAITNTIIARRDQEYLDFVLDRSEAIKALQEINGQFSFSSITRIDPEHVYDNEKFFENISCLDFFIYQLQFTSKQLKRQFDLARQNGTLYRKYQTEIGSRCHLGDLEPKGKLSDKARLDAMEEAEFEKRLFRPTTTFSVTVTLLLSTINGSIYRRKHNTFDENTTLSLITRVQNKSGSFFLDREIWDAICRVERGKVSDKMRFSIYKRDGYRCCHCGRTNKDGVTLEIDHIIPISKGGKSEYNNLQTLCHECNVEKGNRF